jgi:hypothetical protein
LPNSTIKDIDVKEIAGGYELWMSCLGRGIAVVKVINGAVGTTEKILTKNENYLTAYHNPANEKVEIGFNTDILGFVQLSVYEINGKKYRIS